MKAIVQAFDEFQWVEPPSHAPGAYSKLLVNPRNTDTAQFDFRVSLYPPKAKVEEHTHERAEHIYYIMAGRGLMRLGDETRVVVGQDTIFIPPGVSHSLDNNSLEDLLFVVVTSPPGELPLMDEDEEWTDG
jgi:mannose-6-phosphate isomerase-like protein (cupin superfamily)